MEFDVKSFVAEQLTSNPEGIPSGLFWDRVRELDLEDEVFSEVLRELLQVVDVDVIDDSYDGHPFILYKLKK